VSAAKPAAPAEATRKPAAAAAPTASAAPVARPAADVPAQPGERASEPPAVPATTEAPAPTAAAQPVAAADASAAAPAAAVKNDPPVPPAKSEFRTDAADAAPAESAPRAASTDAAPRSAARSGGAAAALDVLRNAGMRVSTDRSRAGAAAKPAAPAAAKPAAPRPAVQVSTPRAAARAPQPDTRQAPPPWEDIPPDEYVPLSADEMFGGPPDDGFVPAFDSGPDDVRVAPKPAVSAPVDTRPLPPAIALDPIGFDGEWPALAARLPLKGVAYQLAFNSELTAVDATTLKLSVPVPQYADAAQVAKLKAALADALGKPVDVAVEVGPARRTAAALDAAARAARQREAEQEIHADPFVQQLVRDFDARIVDGSVRPLADAAASADGASPTLH
ncbi:DNA polymerase III subunit gamma/tau C-terminal domain-containing protein, partial [Burkholderia ubonensis]|uniref:DNA polymerase III subunit gamma/tau C-terminal domain-containing protein n=1 Tax=Burkholderia ubonensis TaxID=101571 RepID=UPI002737EB55